MRMEPNLQSSRKHLPTLARAKAKNGEGTWPRETIRDNQFMTAAHASQHRFVEHLGRSSPRRNSREVYD
eukprot:1625223-Pleurochrysis_carterae.AAC.4